MTSSRRPPLARLATLAALTALVIVTTRAIPQAALADEGDPQLWGRIVLADFEEAGLSREEVAAAFDAALGSQVLIDAMAQADADITMAQPSPETLCELAGEAIGSVEFVETCITTLLTAGISWRYNPNGCRGTLDNPHKSKHKPWTFGSTAITRCDSTPRSLSIRNHLYWNPKTGTWKAFSQHGMIGSDGDYYYAYLSRTAYGVAC